MPNLPMPHPRAPFVGPHAPWAPPMWAPGQPAMPGVPPVGTGAHASATPNATAAGVAGIAGAGVGAEPANAEEETPEDDWLDDTGPDPLIKLPSKMQSVVVEVAMVGLVLSVIAFAAAWLPDLSAFATIVAIVSVPFGIIALIGTLQKGSSGRWMPIASLSIAVLAVLIAIFTQTFAPTEPAPADDAPEAVASSQSSSADAASAPFEQSASSSASERSRITAWSSAAPHVNSTQGVIVDDAPEDTEGWAVGNNLTDLPIGTPAEYATGIAVSVDTVTPGLVNYDGTAITCVTVVYTNVGTTAQTYHQYDWKAESSSGNEVSPCYYTNAQSELGTNEIEPGTTVSGNIYFQGNLSRVIFTPSGANTTAPNEISWLVR